MSLWSVGNEGSYVCITSKYRFLDRSRDSGSRDVSDVAVIYVLCTTIAHGISCTNKRVQKMSPSHIRKGSSKYENVPFPPETVGGVESRYFSPQSVRSTLAGSMVTTLVRVSIESGYF